LPRKNKIPKRSSSQLKNRLKTFEKLGVTPTEEKQFKELRTKLNKLKKDMVTLGIGVEPYVPRVTNFEKREDVVNFNRGLKQFLKDPTVTTPTHKHKIPLKLIEQERKLVEKYNKPIKDFQENINRQKITINGIPQEQTVKEYLDQQTRRKDYTFTEQWRYLNKEELQARVEELKKRTNPHYQRSKNAKASYINAMEDQGLDRTPEGRALKNKIKKMSLKNFMQTLSTEVNVHFDFIYDDNLEPNDRVNVLRKAWGMKVVE
jgi:hypothetical protein